TQFEKVHHAASLNERLAIVRNQFERARADRDLLSGLFDDARERLNRAREDHQAEITSFLSATADWTADLTELPLPFDDAFLSSVTAWCGRPHGSNPFAIASHKAAEDITGNFAESRAHLKQLEKTQNDELARLETELQHLMSA